MKGTKTIVLLLMFLLAVNIVHASRDAISAKVSEKKYTPKKLVFMNDLEYRQEQHYQKSCRQAEATAKSKGLDRNEVWTRTWQGGWKECAVRTKTIPSVSSSEKKQLANARNRAIRKCMSLSGTQQVSKCFA